VCVLGTSFWWWFGRAVTQWCLSVCVSVCLFVLGNHLDAGPVQWPDSSLYLSVCRFACVCSVHHFGGGPVERTDSRVCVCLSVCLSACVCLIRHFGGSCRAVRQWCLSVYSVSVCLCAGTSFRCGSCTAVGRWCFSVYPCLCLSLSRTVVFVCLSVCLSVSLCLVRHLGGLCVLGTSFRWWSCAAVTQWCLSVCVSLCLCVLGNHLGGGPVERSDCYVCLSVCLLGTSFRWWSCRAVRQRRLSVCLSVCA